MKKLRMLCAAVPLAITLAAGAAQAMTIDASWNPAGPQGAFNSGPAFTIEYTDANSNNLFDVGEQTSFTGVLFKSFAGDPGATRDTILHVVDIPGIAASSNLLGNTGWIFGVTNSFTFSVFAPDAFIYTVSSIGVVPLPAAAPMLISAVGAFGLFRLRRRA